MKKFCDIYALDLTLDTLPVVGFVAITKDESPITALWCSAASDPSPVKALKKAMQEVYAQFYCSLRNQQQHRRKKLQPHKIQFTGDHGDLYLNRAHWKHAKFLWHGDKISWKESKLVSCTGLDPLLLSKKGYKTYYVELSLVFDKLFKNRLKTFRAIIPGMLPMLFGYHLVPDAMPRLQKYRKKWKLRRTGVNLFPHPFN